MSGERRFDTRHRKSDRESQLSRNDLLGATRAARGIMDLFLAQRPKPPPEIPIQGGRGKAIDYFASPDLLEKATRKISDSGRKIYFNESANVVMKIRDP